MSDSRLLHANRAARVLLYLAVAAGFLAAICIAGQAWFLSVVVNRVFILHQTLDDVVPFLLILLMLAVLRALLVWNSEVLAQRSASHLKGSLRERLTQQLLRLGPAYTHGERSGELVNAAVGGVEILDEYSTVYQPTRLLAMLVPVFMLLVVLILDPLSTLVLLFTGPVLVLLLALIGSSVKDVAQRRFQELSWMSAYFLDILQGLATLKMFGRSREKIEAIRQVSARYGSTTLEVLRTVFQTALVLEWGSTIATALVAVEIGLRLMSGGLSYERALAVLILTPEFFQPLRQLAIRYHAGAAGKAAADRIFAILDQPWPDQRSATTRSVVPAHLDIRFDRVSFAYANGQRPALQEFSLHIPHGRRVALVGATGAGKSTVANLLLRFGEPQSGSITISGTALGEIDAALWRSQVAWVPQQPHLFYGTLADNIRLAKPTAARDEVIAAATAAHAHEFIAKLPQGYDTPIGEQGTRLSGGQQQRLAIARAFLKDAPLLILDEATSHLDAENEALIQDALDRLLCGRTVLIIAHRLNLIYTADQVVVMQQGRAIETGKHEALLTQNGTYRQLVASYAGDAW
ncbi:MAG TPA: thiol reductant ABC exporter subunit CydD [Anaerolineae bacterium]|nr:thiol reductant ABC exporter subunit CydD [Anaerolineae bacterium]